MVLEGKSQKVMHDSSGVTECRFSVYFSKMDKKYIHTYRPEFTNSPREIYK